MISGAERQFVVDLLQASEAQLVALTVPLTTEQWHFRQSAERWSIAGIVEHLAVFEEFIRGAIVKALEADPDHERSALAREKETLVLGLATSREVKFEAREATRPTGRWSEGAELIAEFREARARTILFATGTRSDLRAHFFQHIAFGDLDCFQWLLLLGQHTLRHCAQIEEVLADARAPEA